MTILADTSGIIALLDRSDRHHTAVAKIVRAEILSSDIILIFPGVNRISILAKSFAGDSTDRIPSF